VNAVTGSVGGASLSIASAFSFQGTSSGVTQLTVVLTDLANACQFVQSNPGSNKANATYLVIDVLSGSSTGGPAPITAGTTYPVPTADAGGQTAIANAAFQKTDAQCASTVAGAATGGSVTITSIADSAAQGTFSLTFAAGTLQGSFDAPTCVEPDAGSGGDGGHPCL
jgi:hypothetical protein